MTGSAQEINFFDPSTNDYPYHAYEQLRDDAPVWKDPHTGMYVLTRYEDIRAAVLDRERFTNRIGNAADATENGPCPDDPNLSEQLRQELELELELQRKYEEHGCPTTPTLSELDEPEHMQRRRLFDHAFRSERIRELDPFVKQLAHRLIDRFIDDRRCEYVAAFAIPLPLYVIGKQMGAPEEDLSQIKAWTDAWLQRMGFTQTPDQRRWSANQEIKAQHYFKKRYEELRKNPTEGLLSDLVNRKIPELGRPLNDDELHAEKMADLFVGGSETTKNALSGGVMLAIQQPEAWQKIKSDPDAYLEPFVEEVLRLESPVQARLRETSQDVELHGVTIPAGSVVALRFAAANRDGRRFECPEELDLDREKPRSHLAFGLGTHHCLGVHLVRRVLYQGFNALVERIDEMRFVEGANEFSYTPSYFLRALKELHIEFTPTKA